MFSCLSTAFSNICSVSFFLGSGVASLTEWMMPVMGIEQASIKYQKGDLRSHFSTSNNPMFCSWRPWLLTIQSFCSGALLPRQSVYRFSKHPEFQGNLWCKQFLMSNLNWAISLPNSFMDSVIQFRAIINHLSIRL